MYDPAADLNDVYHQLETLNQTVQRILELLNAQEERRIAAQEYSKQILAAQMNAFKDCRPRVTPLNQ